MKSKEGIVVLSYFDGMSCGQIALNRLGIKIKYYFACEVDKYAMTVAQKNYPQTIQSGDVVKFRRYYTTSEKNRAYIYDHYYTSVKTKTLIDKVRLLLKEGVDLLIGGSPCQGFSFAGKQLNFKDPRSKLFFEFTKTKNFIQKNINPELFFLLENVNMKRKYLGIISEHMGIFPVRLNSHLVSAQNRDRFYWSNIRIQKVGLFGELHTYIDPVMDRGGIFKRYPSTWT